MPEQRPEAPLLFLSHAGEDREAARALAVALRSAGVEVWLHFERLQPGDLWVRETGAALRRSRALILYLGRSGVARWVDFEVQLALIRAALDRDFRVIPVLGPGANPEALPDFLKIFQWLDLRDDPQPAPETLKGLLAGALSQPAERVSVLPPDRPPFRGLLPFDVEDAVVFFGRERETQDLVGLLGKDPFLLVVGDSGCGKSSLVRAGLVPALLRGRFHDGRGWVSDWRIAIARPGNDPFGELAESLPDLATDRAGRPERIRANRGLLAEGSDGLRDIIAGSVPRGVRTLLVVDQFEELFTLTADPKTRRRHIDCLLRAADTGGSRPVHVVVTLRADFFGRCWDSPELLERVQRSQYLTPRLTVDRLRELIEKPLALAGAGAEPGLVEAMLDDVGDEPGNLALLEHALDQLWQKRRVSGGDVWITHEAYESLGRLAGALGNHANAAMERLRDEAERALARRFFVDLTQLGEGTEDTRRWVKIEELTEAARDREQAIAVLEKLASERLITTGDDYAEVAHEELIRSWPELRRWVDANREFVRRERRLLEDAKEWQRLGTVPEALLRGARIVEAEEWLAAAPRAVPPLVRELVEASTAERKREEDARESQRRAELARLRRTRAVAATVATIFIVLASGLAYYWWSAREATRKALARGLAAQAQLIEINNRDLVESRVLLAVESMRRQWMRENERSVRRALELLARPVALARHRSAVLAVAFSPDRQRVVSGGADRTARVWDAVSGKELARLVHGGPVWKVAFSPEGRRVVSGSEDKTARVWDAATGKEIARFEHGEVIASVGFSPDGQRVVSSSGDGSARVWEAATGREVARFENVGFFGSVTFSPNGLWIVSGCRDGTARVWEAATGNEIARFIHREAGFLASVAFSPDGQRVVSGSSNGTARVWEVATGREIARFELGGGVVTSVAFSPDGQRVVSGSAGGTARVWQAATGKEISRLDFGNFVVSVAFSPDGQQVVGGSSDGTARVWKAATGEEIARVEHSEDVTSVAFSPDGKQVVSGSQDRTARVWETRQGLRHEPHIRSLAISPDGKWGASGQGAFVRVWELATGRELARIENGGTSVAFSPDGKRVASGGWDNTARVWEVPTVRELGLFQHWNSVATVAFSPDGERLVSGSRDNTVRVWELVTGRELARFEHGDQVVSVVVSPDGRRVVSGSSDSTVRVWEMATGQELARGKHLGRVTSVAISPDGKRIVSGSIDHTARIWDATTGKELVRLGHGEAVTAVAFSPNGNWVVSNSRDTARIWDLSTKEGRTDRAQLQFVTGPDCFDAR